MSGYGRTGPGYGTPEDEGGPGPGGRRRPGDGRPAGDGPVWQSDQGYGRAVHHDDNQQGRGAPRGSGSSPGYGQPGYPGQPAARDYGQQDYGDWGRDPADSSFLPGFGPGGDSAGQRGEGRPPRRDDRYRDDDYDRQRGARPGSRDTGGDHYEGPSRRPRRRATRWAPRILILVVFIALVAGALVGGSVVYHKYQARYHPADYASPGTGDVTVQVKSGDTTFDLAPQLVQLGVIASARAFTNAAEAATNTTSASSNGLETGYYVLHHHMQASLAYAALTNPKNLVQTTVTIPEGKRAVDVIAIVARKTKIPLKNFQQVLAHPAQLGLPSYAGGKVEGYLFPATYAIVPHETALQILQAMVTRFNQQAQVDGLVAAANAAKLTPAQLIIEASLAQAEGGSVSDYPKIAEVIHNRIARGMHLQFDSTVLYGLGKYAVSATIKQTRTPGPYNTYLNPGLPAGPISNPGDAAIQGILHPAHGDWLYFLTVPDGKSQFSASPLKGQ